MATTLQLAWDPAGRAAQRWDEIVRAVDEWARDRGVAARDLTVLVPFAQLLPEARRAFARRAGWMPRVETTLTLAASLGPATAWSAGELSFDATIDTFGAAALLRAQPWGAAWERRDARGFERALGALVVTAQALARAAQACAPARRAAYFEAARVTLAPLGGPGATERLLARVALEWAAQAPAPATDRLFERTVHGPWVWVRAGGADALGDALVAHTEAPCLVIDTDVAPQRGLSVRGLARPPAWAVCDGFEHEAQCAAAQVIEHVRQGQCPVALVAQDRVLVRRVRALLERFDLRISDETGWTLSTTRAAAHLMALLRCAPANAGTDALLEMLKSCAAWMPPAEQDAVSRLESHCREHRVTRVAALAAAELEPAQAQLWAWTQATLAPLRAPARRSLADWLQATGAALRASGALQALRADDAGRQVLAALRLDPDAAAQRPLAAWPAVVSQAVLELDAYTGWVDRVLERATFVPASPDTQAAQVVITPMGRAMLRPFEALVLPGADDQRLGASPAPHPLLGDALCAALGLSHAAQVRAQEWIALVHLLDVPWVTLLRRRADGSEPLGDSPWVQRVALGLAGDGRALTPWRDPREARVWPARPLARSVARAPDLLPDRLSASACEALRACPYRFFAVYLLGLREPEELEREVEKRDYGNWLHAVLYAFHRDRAQPQSAPLEIERLRRLGVDTALERGVDAAEFLPFAASFASLAPRYVDWLHARDRLGVQWLRGEARVQVDPPELRGTQLYGVIDRIDRCGGDAPSTLELIDYKTGSADRLRQTLRQPEEDTQLPFYAALVAGESDAPLRAFYLALDHTQQIRPIEHPDVQGSAQALLDGLAHDLERLRAGAGLAALGEGSGCEYCAARGVCRRDHWSSNVIGEALG